MLPRGMSREGRNVLVPGGEEVQHARSVTSPPLPQNNTNTRGDNRVNTRRRWRGVRPRMSVLCTDNPTRSTERRLMESRGPVGGGR